MGGPVLATIKFVGISLIIILSGAKMARYGDFIADHLGLGGLWIGVVLLATATSLPELISAIGAVTIVKAPNIAVSELLGSCILNLSLIPLIGFASKRGPKISPKFERGHLITANFGLLLLAVVAVFIAVEGIISLSIFGIGLYTPAIFLIYLVGVRRVFIAQKLYGRPGRDLSDERVPRRRAYLFYGLYAVIVVTASFFLAASAKEVAAVSGLAESFVGGLFVALTTSLPEATVLFTAVRIGAIDLAIANLLGSNIFNVFVLALVDLAILDGSLLGLVAPVHMISALIAILMTALVSLSISSKPGFKWRQAWINSLIASLFFVNLVFLFGAG
ncbi:MAG: hypothetical protein QMD53_06095 [Actinomycetota bacterium]|nr:hypothetical protein [Actinomycetota bacterium]